MSYLYVNEQGARINFESNRMIVRYKDDSTKSIPVELLEEVSVFGAVQISTQCMQECLKRGINVIFYSKNGSYFGRLISTTHVNVHRQRMQAALYENMQFRLEFSRKIIQAKIKNQIVLIRRYERNSRNSVNIHLPVQNMQYMIEKVKNAETIEQVMGYEGTSAKIYFQTLGQLVDLDFRFSGRNRRPPRDPFNSMLSLGYSILLNEIYGKLEAKGLNPYFGVMHKDREKHPTLASDLMEEWRAPLVDAVVLSLVNGHEVKKEEFYSEEGEEGIFLNKTAFNTFVRKLENKFRADSRYLSYVDYSVSFRRAMELQVMQFVKAMENQNADLYKPVVIR